MHRTRRGLGGGGGKEIGGLGGGVGGGAGWGWGVLVGRTLGKLSYVALVFGYA